MRNYTVVQDAGSSPDPPSENPQPQSGRELTRPPRVERQRWNIANYYAREVCKEAGEIPNHEELKSELKEHNKYTGLRTQFSQRALEELVEAFNSWHASDDGDNPPGYRKQNYCDNQSRRVHEEHTRSTVTWK